MGATYGHISVKGMSRPSLVDWLRARGIKALVGPQEGDWITFSDRETDEMDLDTRDTILRSLTREVPCVAVAVFVYDEEDLQCVVARDGALAGRYWLCPGMIMNDPTEADMRPRLDDAATFFSVLGITDEAAARAALNVGGPDTLHPFNVQETLVALAGLPSYGIGFGYRYAKQGEWDPDQGDLVEV